ncbi:MAG: CpaF family protein [Chloroflexi bacterium]|nr:MAG: CpaF family protein [Chloroflexota bacterium]MBL1193745.1 CpaF family protein [Chloroflexota bacterium]NOH11038.1 CpaF family protein [Chloroflexota bacterium]
MAEQTLSAKDLKKLEAYLLRTLSNQIESDPPPAARYREKLESWLEQAFASTKTELPEEQRQKLFDEVLGELVGYGPIQPLLDDPTISEVMVNGPDLVFVERDGELIETDVKFDDDDHVLRIINRMIHPLGRRVDSDHPSADARLPDGSRVNVIIPPVAHKGSCITVRKFVENKLTMEDIIGLGTLTPHMSEFLQACVVARLNVLISGNTSSGKTTMLNVMTDFIPGGERIVTIEDAAELRLKQRHVISLETKQPNMDGKGGMGTRELVRNTLRMRPDRIVVGEVRSGEALDMLQSMNTGHDGSMTTLHANSPRDAIARLETMAMMAGLDMPLLAIRKQIASAINLIVHMARLPDGTRKMARITEVAGMEGEVVTLSDIFKFEQESVDKNGMIVGKLMPTGIRPVFTPKLEVAGYNLGGDIFGAGLY